MPMLDIQRRHAQVFRLRLGDKSKTGSPQKLTDAIRVTSPNRSVVDAFVDVYGGETVPWVNDGPEWQAYLPTTEVSIMMLPGQSITQWWELYKKTVCERRCDGITEALTGTACKCPADITDRMAMRGACRPMTRINVLCPDVAVVGAGALVSHGMIAAETLPQSVKVAEAALERGLMVPAVLRVVEHKGKRHFVVPQLEIVGVSLNTLGTGEAPAVNAPPPMAAIGSGGGEQPTAPRDAQAAPALPPLPGELNTPCPERPCDFMGENKQHVALHLVHAHGWTESGGKVHHPSPGDPPAAGDVGAGEAAPAHPDAAPAPATSMTDAQRRKLMPLLAERGLADRQDRLDWAALELHRPVPTFSALTKAEAGTLIEAAEALPLAPTLE